MIRILLIRHGHTELLGKVLYGRMPGIHLSDRGREEASRLARGLQDGYQIEEILSSPLDRAKETAELIAAVHHKTITFDDRLQELDFGNWMGKPFSELAEDEKWKQYNQLRSLTSAPCGELMTEVQARSWSALQTVIDRHSGTSSATIAVVTHGDIVRALLMLFLGMPLDYIHRLEVWTASVSEVRLGVTGPQVININRTF